MEELKLYNPTGKEIKNVDIAITIYTILLYLLYKPLDEILRTAFICGIDVPEQLRLNLPNSILYNQKQIDNNGSKFSFFINYQKKRRCLVGKFPFLATANIYGQDHCGDFYPFIRRYGMCVIEDGVGLYHPLPPEYHSRIGHFLFRLFGIVTNPWGRGTHCNSILYTGIMPLPNDLKKKKHIKINPHEAWNLASEEKKLFILKVFGVSKNDFDIFNERDIWVLTQPLEELGYSTEEKIKLFKDAIMQYDYKRVVFKNHPRDHTDYSKILQGTACLKKPIPWELINFVYDDFKIAITYNSTAIFNMKAHVEKVILDSKYQNIETK